MRRGLESIILAVLIIGGGAFVYVFWFAGGSGEPSTDLTTPELASTSSTTTDPDAGTEVILDSGSDEHELITFFVTSIDGLEGALSVGDTIDFALTGDLVIKGTVQTVTFETSITMADENTVEGSAAADITRDMYGIGIPSVPSVADVTNEVLIGLDFVAVAG